MSDYHRAGEILAALNNDGIAASLTCNGAVRLTPASAIAPRHRQMAADCEAPLAALISLRSAAAQASRKIEAAA